MTADANVHFHDEMAALERRILGMAEQAEKMVGMAVNSVIHDDPGLADLVIGMDDEIDRVYLTAHHDWTSLMARGQPLGADLRRMTVLLQLNAIFERMGDQCVNIAKIAKANAGLPRVDRVCAVIREMGDLVREMMRSALGAYVREDVDEARLLPTLDEPVDRLNASMYKEAVAVRADPSILEWATRVLMVSRALERLGDQAVDLGEMTAYLVTGERVEFDESGIMLRDA
ncbi:MAG TPA: phosphate signaling complex protein PhoU [Acidimicrobiia bacterium]|nr:MAG: phosphate transport system regulatory protein PhoU [Actinomycetota bacterium]